MDYIPVQLNDELIINKIYTVHYFELSSDYGFPGEDHNFWEIAYVDKGEIIAYAGKDNSFPLKHGQIIFHKPGEWHNHYANGCVAPNMATISFECKSEIINFFDGKIFSVGKYQKDLISKIINEAKKLFKTPLGDPYTKKFEKNTHAPIGSEQLIRQWLCELIISYMRTECKRERTNFFSSDGKNPLLDNICLYMENNLDKKLTLNDISKYTLAGKATIMKAFRENIGIGAIEYFISRKIEYAKKLIRENNYNMSQISQMLGYESIHYFSRQFKSITNMSPTEYKNSIKSLNH